MALYLGTPPDEGEQLLRDEDAARLGTCEQCQAAIWDEPCPTCFGAGYVDGYECIGCAGDGWVGMCYCSWPVE